MSYRNFILLIIAASITVSASTARAAYTYTFEQVGNNVIGIGTGSLNLTGLTSVPGPSAHDGAGVASGTAILVSGFLDGDSTMVTLKNISGPATFGGVDDLDIGADFSSGYGVYFDGTDTTMFFTGGYVSGTPLLNTNIYNNVTLAGLDLAPGTYTYLLNSGFPSADTFTVQVNAVPEPATYALLGIGAIALGLSRRRFGKA